MTLARGNANDPYSPNTRKVADAFWRACLGEPQTFKNDMKALAAASWFTLNSSLTDMTRNDCNAGVQRACQALSK